MSSRVLACNPTDAVLNADSQEHPTEAVTGNTVTLEPVLHAHHELPIFSQQDLLSDNYFSQFIAQSADDFLLRFSQNDSLDADTRLWQE